MYRTLVWSAVWGTLALNLPVSSAQDGSAPGHLVARTQWSRLDLAQGRIKLRQLRMGPKATVSFADPATGLRETLTFSADSPELAALHYQYEDQHQQLSLDIEQGNQVSLARLPRNPSVLAVLRLQQPARGPLQLVIDDGHGLREVSGDSFWHLTLAAPDDCRLHLLPVLEAFRPGWQLQGQALQLEESLLAIARTTPAPDVERVARLVEQLRAADFRSRQSADRELRDLGPAVLPDLERLDEGKLDAEQRLRLTRIRRALAGADVDTPARVAVRLSGDSEVWLALLGRDDAQKRVAASERLSLLTGRAVGFDPHADEAARQQQRLRVRAELGLDPRIRVGNGNRKTELR